jgi:hypothetical protein
MSVSGLNQQYLPNTLDGLNIVEADQVYIDGQLVNLSDYVPYENATRTLNMGAQNIQTTHNATTGNDVVNKTHLDNVVSNLSIAIAGSFLDKVTTTPQTVIGNVSYTAQLSADDLLVPATKKATLGSVLSIDANYTTPATDAGVITRQYFGSITSSMGIYQATTTQNYAILQLADLGVAGTGKRTDIVMNWNINEPSYNSSIQLFASDNGTSINQYLTTTTVSFTPSDSLYKVMEGTFVPAHRYICALCITANPSGVQTVRWYGLQLDEQGVELTNVTMPSLTADRVAVLNGNKQLVSSGISTTKLDYLDNVSSDIQTQLNGKLNLSGGTMTGDIVMGSNKVTSTATPTTDDTLTRKGYVDTQDNLRVLKSGDTMTGSLIMGAFKVTSSAIPVIGDDYTNKTYVDTAITGLGATYAKLAGPQTFTGTHTFSNVSPITLSGLMANRLLGLSVAGNVQAVSVTLLEASYLSGVTSAIQTQINGKASTSYVDTQDNLRVLKAGDTMTGTLGLTSSNIIEFGSGVSGKDGNAGKIGYQAFTTGCLDMVGAGTTASDRRIRLFDKVGVGQNPDIGIFQIGKTGSADFFVLNNATYAGGQYINQRFLFGSTTGTNRSAYIQGYMPSTDKTEIGFHVDGGTGTVVERLRVSGEGTNGSVYVNAALGVGVSGTSIDTNLYVVGKGKFHDVNVSAPSNGTNGGPGTRLILWPGDANSCPYALGINGGTLWYGTPTTGVHKWYNGTTNVMTLDTGGNLILNDRLLNVVGGTAYAVPNNHMAAGSLTLGGIDRNYGGGSFWTSSTAGLLFECQSNTEIAIHDSGDRVASFMYYVGGGFTIGRDMGWGASPASFASNLGVAGNLQVNGNVGIGTTSPNGALHVYRNTNGGTRSYVVNPNSGSGSYALFAVINNTGNGCVLFQNSNTRTEDGGVNTATLRNDAGRLRLMSNSGTGMAIEPGGYATLGAGDSSVTVYGANATWGAYLRVGSGTNAVNANTAQVISTNGNLHLDAGLGKELYLNYYPYQAGNYGMIKSYGTLEHTGLMVITGNNLSVGGDITGAQVYTNDWFRINNSNSGLYWQSIGRGLQSPEGMGNPYGHVTTYGYGRNGWFGYGLWTRFCFMGDGGNQWGIHDNIHSWIIRGDGFYDRKVYLAGNAVLISRNWDIFMVHMNLENTGSGYFYVNQGAGYGIASDSRIKRNIEELSPASSIKFIKGLKPSSFCMKNTCPTKQKTADGQDVEYEEPEFCCCAQEGFIAQNVLESAIQAGVSRHVCNHWYEYEEEMKKPVAEQTLTDKNTLGVNDRPILSHTVNAVKGLMEEIDILTQRNQVLETWAREQEVKMAKMQKDLEKMAGLVSQLISKQ